MPYIDWDARRRLMTDGSWPKTPGELNYLITTLCRDYLKEGYAGINEVIGALECAKMEFYRRVAVPYEEEKMKLNGDVY